MSEGNLQTRDEVQEDLKWDLSRIFVAEEEFRQNLQQVKEDVEEIVETYEGELNEPGVILSCLEDYEELMIAGTHLYTYAHLANSVDETDPDNQERLARTRMLFSQLQSSVSFIESEIKELDVETIDEAIEATDDYSVYLKDLKREKQYKLTAEEERTISALSPVLDSFQQIYNKAKLADLEFESFEVGGEKYPLSFVKFENEYQLESDKTLRRRAFEEFSSSLSDYQHTMAATYSSQIQKEKILADRRGYDSIFSYLLFDQKVDRELYDRQIDMIMEKLAPHMRKYARLLGESHDLDEVTFADLKVPLDPEFEPEISVEKTEEYVKNALGVLGDEYLERILNYREERWVDFAQNKGKSTGGFCSTPYGLKPYILLSWSGLMSELYTLVHELGHADHFLFAQEHNTLFESRPSTYFVEAPSTINELFLTDYLLESRDDPRFQRWALATMIGNTYFHNFVTHLLEAAYQRRVYELIEEGEGVHAQRLNELKRDVLEEFWGDEVRINEGAELTWMRQPHYYMGLYPYTYSAGLTIATAVNRRIQDEGESAVEDWLEVLKAGGSKEPVELARMADVDVTNAEPLEEAISFVGDSIDRIAELSEKIES